MGGGGGLLFGTGEYFKPRKDLSINSNDVESLCIEIFNATYRPPNGDMKVFEKFCENLLSVNNKILKNIFAADLNINVLDYESNEKVQHFISNMFQYNMIKLL